jgi:hypothetical protein
LVLFLSLYSGSSIFIFCEYSTTKDNKEQKPKHLQTKFKQPSIKQLGILPPPFLLALEITIISGTKKRNLVQVEWGDKKLLYNTQTVEGIV